ncbi:DUF3108 domain-containing protein [Photobacterium sp. CCB-ST2H9]|uniref:DUF3108 domain-containing protein n=1 Tax=Photobacterium sp. CCB-ST2H9 TaxID=2912855 RepID=UPI002004C50B|nr:DUF3108 domain-containing protein [Photobacterium sp. CCB-ST2H9]UTM58418.1 DUF3108 domain-containing protein [Photobacterium sp. CCB-ST2H9]
MSRLILSAFLTFSMASSAAMASPPVEWHQCVKTLTYDLYYGSHKIGFFERKLSWENNQQVEIRSRSKLSALVMKTNFEQQTRLVWSDLKNSFITQSFNRTITGLLDGTTRGQFNQDGTRSDIVNDGEKMSFNSSDLPLLDVEAVASQMRLNLIQGKKTFDFKMQESDDVSHYYFRVAGEETLNTNYGKVKAIRVEQIKKPDRVVNLWFSPELDYQLVRGTYKRKILDLKAVLRNKREHCPQTYFTSNLSEITAQSGAMEP